MENSIAESNRLIEELWQPVYIADIETYEILYMNKAGRKNLHCDDYAGKKCYKVIQGREAPCPFCRNARLKKDKAYCWEYYNEIQGMTYQLQDNLIDYQGHRARIEVVFGVSDHTLMKNELQTVFTTQRELVTAMQLINGTGTIEERLNAVMKNSGEYFQADRAYIFLINEQGSLDNAYEWCRDGVGPQIGNLQAVDIRSIDRWMPYFKENKAVVTPDIEKIKESRPEEYRILKEQDIRSIIEAPLYNDGRLIGFIGLDNPSPEKIENAGELLLSLAYAIANAYSRAANEQEQQEMFRHTIQSLLTANPESLCTFRVNLTKNFCKETHGISKYVLDYLQSDTVDGMIGNISGLIPIPEEREEFLKNFNRTRLLELYHGGTPDYFADYRRRAENGRRIWVRTFVRMLRNPESGDIEGIIYSLNVTKEKFRDRVFSILTDREYDYEALLDPKNNTIRFLNLSSRLLPKYQEKLGKPDAVFPYGEVCRFAADTFVAAEDRDFYFDSCRMETITEHLEKEEYYEYQLRGHYTGKPDEFMYRRLQYYYLDDSRETILLVQSDVTNAVLRQKKENEYVEDIMDSVSAGIVVLRMPDADHLEGMFVNMQMFRILGMEKPEGPDARQVLLGDPLISAYMKDAFSAVHPDDLERVRKAFRDGYDKDYLSAGNYRILKQDGSPVWVNQEAILREVRPDGHIFYACYRVVEREVELQAELKRQLENEKLLRDEADSANSAKTDFLSRMSHDIRTPLNGIIGMAYLAGKETDPEVVKDHLEKIETSAKFQLNLINEILDMSKVESGVIDLCQEPYPVNDFTEYLDAVIRPLCEGKHQNFILEMNPIKGYSPLTDISKLNRIYFNLLSNAVKFTPEGGTVKLTVKEVMTDETHIRFTIIVSDSGIGISPEFQKHLFEPFTQENRNDNSKVRGSGLGLAIVKKIVDAMGGSVSVESTEGKGTKFTVNVTSGCVKNADLETEDARKEQDADEERMAISGMRILLCEDHPLNQEIAKALLEEKGAAVQIAEDGQKGIEAFSQSAVGYFSCILMDIRMPVKDGYETAEAIRALKRPDAKRIPIIAMTADAFEDDVLKCLNAGMNGHIAKPIDPELLYREISEAVMK